MDRNLPRPFSFSSRSGLFIRNRDRLLAHDTTAHPSISFPRAKVVFVVREFWRNIRLVGNSWRRSAHTLTSVCRKMLRASLIYNSLHPQPICNLLCDFIYAPTCKSACLPSPRKYGFTFYAWRINKFPYLNVRHFSRRDHSLLPCYKNYESKTINRSGKQPKIEPTRN